VLGGEKYISEQLNSNKLDSKQKVYMRFHVLTAASMKFRDFWDVAPCSHFEVDRHFRGA
jgi:hypothetical protein